MAVTKGVWRRGTGLDTRFSWLEQYCSKSDGHSGVGVRGLWAKNYKSGWIPKLAKDRGINRFGERMELCAVVNLVTVLACADVLRILSWYPTYITLLLSPEVVVNKPGAVILLNASRHYVIIPNVTVLYTPLT
jgi:hypothetical protein